MIGNVPIAKVVDDMENYQINTKFGDIEADLFLLPGFFSIDSGYSGPFHSHQHVECHIVHCGTLDIQTAQHTYRLTAGDLCFLPRLTEHCICGSSEDIQKCSFNLRFVQRKQKEPQLFEEYNRLFEINQVIIIHKTTLFDRYYHPIASSITGTAPDDRIRLQAATTMLLLDIAELLRTYHANDVPTAALDEREESHEADEYLFNLEVYIQRHYMEDISLETAAKHLHLSPRQIGRLLKSHSGRSFGETLLHQRMWAARELLADPSIPISRIPAMVGYRSYPGFYSSFRKFWGMPPNQFRKQLRQKEHNQL